MIVRKKCQKSVDLEWPQIFETFKSVTNRSLHDSTMEDSALILFQISVSLNTTEFSGQNPSKIDKNQKTITQEYQNWRKKHFVQFVVDGRPHNDLF